MRRSSLGLALLLPLVLAGCLPRPVAPPPPEPTATALPPTETPTPTIVWFPATATYTPYPTPMTTLTFDLSPDIGGIIFTDDFSKAGSWSLGRTQAGSAALGKNELTLHVSEPEGYVFSLRQEPILQDFYVEITASPAICRDGDEYGLLLRVSPALEFYRFSLTCNGQYRLDKYVDGEASSARPLTMSGAVPPGAPSQSRLAVWVGRREIRFFINDQYQFTLEDNSLTSGLLGLFARAAGENVVTVSFSDLLVKRTR